MLLKTIVSLACIITLVNAGPNRLTEPKDVVITDYNSGFIPGTKIRVEGLTNSATGKPVDFAKFTDKFLAIPAPASVAKNSLVKRDEDGLRGHDDNSKYLRMLCIPLISKNPTGNPYHKDLVSYENPHYFRGPGYPMVFPVSGVRCPKDSPGPCGITVTKEITYTNTLAYAVSDSKSNSFSKNVGGSRSSSNSSSTAITISESIEHSTTVSKTKTTEESTAHQFGDVTSTGWIKVMLHCNPTLRAQIHQREPAQTMRKTRVDMWRQVAVILVVLMAASQVPLPLSRCLLVVEKTGVVRTPRVPPTVRQIVCLTQIPLVAVLTTIIPKLSRI